MLGNIKNGRSHYETKRNKTTITKYDNNDRNDTDIITESCDLQIEFVQKLRSREGNKNYNSQLNCANLAKNRQIIITFRIRSYEIMRVKFQKLSNLQEPSEFF